MLPEIRISDQLAFPTYFAFLSLLYCIMLLLLPWWARRQNMTLSVAMRSALIMMVAGVIGARMFHVFFENPSFYRYHWERIFFVWLGGFVFFGGALAGGIFTLIDLKIKGQALRPWMDFWAPVIAFGYGVGRMACFLNGCCYGQSCELPWAIGGHHPTQLYAVAWELSLLALLLILQRREWWSPGRGRLFWLWILGHGAGRIMMEVFRGDDRGPLLVGLSISTWISFALILMSLASFAWDLSSKRARVSQS